MLMQFLLLLMPFLFLNDIFALSVSLISLPGLKDNRLKEGEAALSHVDSCP